MEFVPFEFIDRVHGFTRPKWRFTQLSQCYWRSSASEFMQNRVYCDLTLFYCQNHVCFTYSMCNFYRYECHGKESKNYYVPDMDKLCLETVALNIACFCRCNKPIGASKIIDILKNIPEPLFMLRIACQGLPGYPELWEYLSSEVATHRIEYVMPVSSYKTVLRLIDAKLLNSFVAKIIRKGNKDLLKALIAYNNENRLESLDFTLEEKNDYVSLIVHLILEWLKNPKRDDQEMVVNMEGIEKQVFKKLSEIKKKEDFVWSYYRNESMEDDFYSDVFEGPNCDKKFLVFWASGSNAYELEFKKGLSLMSKLRIKSEVVLP